MCVEMMTHSHCLPLIGTSVEVSRPSSRASVFLAILLRMRIMIAPASPAYNLCKLSRSMSGPQEKTGDEAAAVPTKTNKRMNMEALGRQVRLAFQLADCSQVVLHIEAPPTRTVASYN